MHDDPDVQNMLDLLSAPGLHEQKQHYTSILDYVDNLSNQYDSIMEKLSEMTEKLGDITERKNPFSVMVERLTNMVSAIGEKLKALKDSIMEFTKNTLEAAKDKSLSAAGAVAGTLHISEGLEAISKSLDKAAAKVENAEQFHLDRVESNFLAEYEIPSDFTALSQDELKQEYTRLLKIGMDGDLSGIEYELLRDMIDEIEPMLPEQAAEPQPAQELESEADLGEEI
jgi:DNA gyrase/topoisomerase IV subunit A